MGGNQSIRLYNIPVTEKKDGETPIFRNLDHQKELIFEPVPGVTNVQELILHGYKSFPKNEFLGTKNLSTNQYEYITYEQTITQAKALGSSLKRLGFVHEIKEYKNYSLQMIGIYSKNRKEWTIADIANGLYGFTMIPLYDSLGPDSISFVLRHSKITTCYCSLQSIITLSKTKELHSLQNIIAFDPVTPELIAQFGEKGIKIFSFEEVITQGLGSILDLPKLNTDDIFTFSYTSGTTGDPKGAMISHRNILSAVSNHEHSDIKYLSTDTHLSYLPLPHIFERFVNVSCWLNCTRIAFYSGDILRLKEDLVAAKPTVLMTVPRLLNRFYDGIVTKLDAVQGAKKSFMEYAIKTKLENVASDAQVTHFLYDKLIFDSLKEVFGGRLRTVVCGSAPVSPTVLNFFKVILCCPVLEGYGQTEACGLETVQCIKDNTAGHVGGILPSIELKLLDTPEMEYYSTDKDAEGSPLPRGEICIRGHSIIPGYYKEEEKTKEAIDEDGWLHSGDIGCLQPNGGLKIIDRKKNIFKLSQGEYVSPEKVENIYVRARGVAEAFVHGESLYNYPVAVLVPHHDEIKKIAQEIGVQGENVHEISKHDQIIDFYLKTIHAQGKKEGLFTFEQAQKIHIEPVSLAVHGCLTTSFKLQRHHAKSHFKEIIEKLYQKEK